MHRALTVCVVAIAAAVPFAGSALADFNDKNPITATVTGATPTGYPRTMVEGLNAVVREAYPGSAVSFKPNSPGGGVLAIAEKASRLHRHRDPARRSSSPTRARRRSPRRSRASSPTP